MGSLRFFVGRTVAQARVGTVQPAIPTKPSIVRDIPAIACKHVEGVVHRPGQYAMLHRHKIDLTGSSDQVETGFNVPFEGSTKVACFCAIRSLLLDAETSEIKVPSNQGSFRPISVIAPKGSIYNPNFPAAAEARFSQINRVIDLTYKALAPVLSNDIIAGSSATLSFAAYSGLKPDGEYWVFLEVNEGSYGGRPASDGPDWIDSLMANTRNNPLQDLAVHLPMICDRYELRDDVMPGRAGSGAGSGW